MRVVLAHQGDYVVESLLNARATLFARLHQSRTLGSLNKLASFYDLLDRIGRYSMADQQKPNVVSGPTKVGRNAACPCGSCLKFKNCCLGKTISQPKIMASKDGRLWAEAPPELYEKASAFFREKQRKEQDRVRRFGHVRPQMSSVAFGERIVAVRNRLYSCDKWKYFPDFLRDYVPEIFGIEWCKEEAERPEPERHPVITWRAQAAHHANDQAALPDGSRVVLPSGAFAAFNCFAYDLFTVDDNGGLDDELIRRLKVREHFQGARHELFSEATCYRAGFTVEHENEKTEKPAMQSLCASTARRRWPVRPAVDGLTGWRGMR